MNAKLSLEQINGLVNKLPVKDQQAIHKLNMDIVAMLTAAGPIIGGTVLCLANATFMVTMEEARARRAQAAQPKP